jgi:hypothetical protein
MSTQHRFLYRAVSQIPYFSADGDTYLAEVPLRDLQPCRKLRVLSEADFEFWQTYGHTVVREAIPADAAKRLLEFAWDFQGLDPNNPDEWYPDRQFRSDLDRDLSSTGSWRHITISSSGTTVRRSESTTHL